VVYLGCTTMPQSLTDFIRNRRSIREIKHE
jgi:hypothetical protein